MLTLARVVLSVVCALAGLLGGLVAMFTHGPAAALAVLLLCLMLGAVVAPDV